MLKVRCQAHATVDAKGRLAMPAALRHACKEADVGYLVLTFHRGSVWGMTRDDFEQKVERRLEDQDPFAADVLDFTHALLATAQDVRIDGNGRINIPPLLRDLAGLDKDVVVSSLLNRIEIWDRAAWEERFKTALERTAKLGGMPRGESW